MSSSTISAPSLSPLALPSGPAFFERAHGWWLLLVLPLCAALVYFFYLQLVDLDWLYTTKLLARMGPEAVAEIAPELAAKSPLWHFGKQATWPIVLLCAESLCICIMCLAFGQLSGANVKYRQLFVLGLWSKATFLLTALVIYCRLALAEAPVRLLPTELDPLSWNVLLGLQGDRPLQFFTCNQGPLVLLSAAILAVGFRQLSGRGWMQCLVFGALPYALWSALQYYLFGVMFK